MARATFLPQDLTRLYLNLSRKMLRAPCGYFEDQRRVQFEGCVAELLHTDHHGHPPWIEVLAPSDCAARPFERSDEGVCASGGRIRKRATHKSRRPHGSAWNQTMDPRPAQSTLDSSRDDCQNTTTTAGRASLITHWSPTISTKPKQPENKRSGDHDIMNDITCLTTA